MDSVCLASRSHVFATSHSCMRLMIARRLHGHRGHLPRDLNGPPRSTGSGGAKIPSSRLRDEGLLAVPIEARLLIEAQSGFVFPAGEQHDFVAMLPPGSVERVREHRFPPPLSTMRRMSDDILDDAIRAAGTREVWNDGERTARNKRARCVAAKVLDSRIRERLGPNRFGDRGRRRWIVTLVQMRVQAQQRLELV